MTPWARIDPAEYRALDLRAHTLLRGVPLHDVWRLELPGGGDGRTVADVRDLGRSTQPSAAVRALFSIRWLLGRVFRWDTPLPDPADMFRDRLSQADREASLVKAGARDGPFSVLYVFPREAASEIRNGTVHAALVWTLTPHGPDYRMFWAIYVRPVGWLTGSYMRLIEPFRRWIVYPSLLKRLHLAWCAKYAPGPSGTNAVH